MILFVMLLIALLTTVICIGAGGLVGAVTIFVLFGDVVVCAAIIIWIIKRIANRKK